MPGPGRSASAEAQGDFLRLSCEPGRYDLRAAALPPLRPAAFFCAVVPPCFELERELEEPDFLPPRLDAPGAFEIRAARSLDMPFSLSFSYCFSFLTLGRLFGMGAHYPSCGGGNLDV
jgi:hypothetical protein